MSAVKAWASPRAFFQSVLRNILPGGFFAGQDIPELLDDSLLLSISKTKTLCLRQLEPYLLCHRIGSPRASIPAEKKLGQRILCSMCGFAGAKSGSRTDREQCGQHQHNRIAGGEYDFQLWGDVPEISRKVAAILSRKNDIRQQQPHDGSAFVEYRDRFRRGSSFQHSIAGGLENLASHLAEEAFIFH
jgi:hypothetical protein